MNIEKVNSTIGCGKCIFCLSKCPKCETADVKIEYTKTADESWAFVACKCGQTNIKIQTMPIDISGDENGVPVEFRSYDQTRYEVPELTALFDKETQDYQPAFQYRMTNNTEDKLTVELEKADSESDLPSTITFTITDKTDKHCMLESVHTHMEIDD